MLKSLAKRVVGPILRMLPDAVVARLVSRGERFDPATVPDLPSTPSTPVRLFIGPANMAGQGYRWARAAELIDGVGARSMAAPKAAGFGFEADVRVPYYAYRWSRSWNRRLRAELASRYTHVLVESARPLFGDALARKWTDDVRYLREAGVRVAAVFHGSDIRLPSRHAAALEFSPFHDPMSGQRAVLESQAAATQEALAHLGLPTFVSTPDQLIDVPSARWLPVVVDPGVWRPGPRPMSVGRTPVVVHVPSRSSLKGSVHIDAVLGALADEGIVEYRRLSGIAASQMPSVIAAADIVVDQLAMGIYGVAACEAMAAGRIVVSEVREQVRDHVRTEAGLELPIIGANPRTIDSVIRGIVADASLALERAALGPEFVATVHDGARSAAALRDFLLA